MEKFTNETLRHAGLELMNRNGIPLRKIPSQGRSMIYAMPNGETVRIRTSRVHVLMVNANESILSKVPNLNIEGTDWLLIVMPAFERNENRIIAYLVPTTVAVDAIKTSHQHLLDSSFDTYGNNKMWCLWFDKEFSGKESCSQIHNFGEKWAKYQIEGYIGINENELVQTKDSSSYLKNNLDIQKDNSEQFTEIIATLFTLMFGKNQNREVESTSLKQDVSYVSNQLDSFYSTIKEELELFLRTFTAHIDTFETYIRTLNFAEETGWIPHRSIKNLYSDLLNKNCKQASNILANYYQSNSNKILKSIELGICSYNIDNEAKEAFREIISAHRTKHYRCVCCTVFPEIERVIRSYFPEKNKKRISKVITELTEKEYFDEYIKNDPFAIVAFVKLIEHIYINVNDSNISEYKHDSVPNRHATVHGLVSYSTMKHSLNSIIIADNIFSFLKQCESTVTNIEKPSCN